MEDSNLDKLRYLAMNSYEPFFFEHMVSFLAAEWKLIFFNYVHPIWNGTFKTFFYQNHVICLTFNECKILVCYV